MVPGSTLPFPRQPPFWVFFDIINYMNIRRIIYSILAILLGVFMFVYAGIDDSPGGQLLGLIVVIAGIIGVIKSKKKKSS